MKRIIIFLFLLVTGATLVQSPFQHQARSGNTDRHITTIDNPATNGKANNLLFVSQVYGKIQRSPDRRMVQPVKMDDLQRRPDAHARIDEL